MPVSVQEYNPLGTVWLSTLVVALPSVHDRFDCEPLRLYGARLDPQRAQILVDVRAAHAPAAVRFDKECRN